MCSFRRISSTTVLHSEATAAGGTDVRPFVSQKVETIFNKMVALDREELVLVGEIYAEKLGLNIIPEEMSGGSAPADDDVGQEEESKKEEKTHFDLKLTAFDAKSKIKVIKEVRSITGLGLKEAKEMVESAPKVVQKDIKMEEAEELKKKLEAVGATIEIS